MTRLSPATAHVRRHQGTKLTLSIIAHSLALAYAAPVIANPLGPVIVNGSASLAQSNGGKALTVTNTPGAILNWNSFSIGTNESVRFVQQNAASQVLNRVVGADPSQILGSLNSNGRVFLINPNGIAFGASSQVNVAGLVASTLNLSDADFLAGLLRFQATPGAGKLSNLGTIQAINGGQIYLIGSAVENGGVLTAPNGDIILAAGKTVNLVDARNPEITVEINAPANQALNLGQIVARNVSMLAGAIVHSGAINADAAVIGDGGRILLRATDTAKITGTLTARGGSSGGNGGFIETSAKTVDFAGASVDASATKGIGGQWLIDPTDVVIDAAAAGAIQNALNTGTNSAITTPDGSIAVNSAITKTAGADATLTLNAFTGITVNAPISSTSGMLNVTLNGGSANTINSTVEMNGGVLTIGAPTALNGGTIRGGTIISSMAAAKLVSPDYSGGTLDNVTLNTDLDIGFLSTVTVPAALTVNAGKSINFVSNNGNLNFTGAGNTPLLTGGGNVVFNGNNTYLQSLSAGSTLTVDSGITIKTGPSGTSGGRGTVGRADATTGLLLKGTVQANTNGAIAVSGTDWQNQGTIQANGGNIFLDGTVTSANLGTINIASGSMNLRGTLDNTGSTYDLGVAGNTGNLSLAGGTIKGGTLTSTTAAKLVAPDYNGGTLDNVTLNTDLNIGYGSTVSVPTALTINAAKSINFTSNGGNLNFTGGGGAPLLTGGGTVLFNGAGNYVQSLNPGSTLTVDSGVTIKTGLGGTAGGRGTVGRADATTGVVLKGTVQANTGGEIAVSGSNWQNEGLIRANGGNVYLQGSWSNPSGTLSAQSGSILLNGTYSSTDIGTVAYGAGTFGMQNGTWTNTGQDYNLDAMGGFRLFGGTIVGGTISSTTAAKLVAPDYLGGTLDNVKLNTDLDIGYASTVNVPTALTINAGKSVNFRSYGGNLNFTGAGNTPLLAGDGNVVFNYSNNYVQSLNPGSSLTVDSGVTIKTGASGGSGTVGRADATTGVVLKGTVQANTGGEIAVSGSNWQNEGLIRADGGNVYLQGSWSNPSGTLSAQSGTILLNGTYSSTGIGTVAYGTGKFGMQYGTWTNTGQDYNVDAMGGFQLMGGSAAIVGGTLTSTTAAKLLATTYGGTLSNVTLNTDLDIAGYSTVTIPTALTLNAGKTINFTSNNSNLNFTGNGSTPMLTGRGTVVFNGYNNYVQSSNPGSTLTVDGEVTIKTGTAGGAGTVGRADGTTGLLLKGTVQANTNGTIVISGTDWQNQGIIKSDGGTVTLTGTNWTNAVGGLIQSNTGTVSINNLPVNNGVLEVASTGTMVTNNSDLTNSATGVIRGTGALDLGYSSIAPVFPSTVITYNLKNLTNNGTIDPGLGMNGIGQLTIKGNLVMGTSGKLHLDLGGTSTGQYDQLAVVGSTLPSAGYKAATASLNGTLEVAEVGASVSGGFFADKGNAFPNLLTVNGGNTGLSGNFATQSIQTSAPADVAFTFATAGAPGIVDTTVSISRLDPLASGNWSNPANWLRGVPGAGKDAIASLSAPSTITIGSIVATPATLVLDANLNITAFGSLTLPVGTTSDSKTLRLSGGTLINPNTLTLGSALQLESGSISGSGSLILGPGGVVKTTRSEASLNQPFSNNSTVTVGGGLLTLTGSGTHTGNFDVAGGATLDFAGGNQQLADGSRFTNTGSFLHSGGTTQLTGLASGLTIDPTTTVDLTALAFTGTGKLTNLGTVNGSATSFGGTLVNQGIANLSNGTVLTGGFVNSGTGIMNITQGNVSAGGATAELAGGSLNLQNGASLTKSGGALNWSGGTIDGAGTLAFTNGGLIGFTGAGERTLNNPNLNFTFTDLNLPSGSLILRSGSLAFNTSANGSTAIPAGTTLAMYGGVMANNGPIDISGLFGLYGGSLTGNGAINMTGGVIDMPASSGVNWMASGALTNSGVLNLSDRTISSAMTNAGTINSTGNLTFSRAFTNQGTFNETAGTTVFSNGYLQTGGFTKLGTSVTAPANITVGGSGAQINGGTLGGSGTITGNLSMGGGTLSPGFSPGSLTLTGNLILSPSSTTVIELGGLTPGSGYDVINVGGTANLAGALNVVSYAGYVPAAGTTYNFLNYGSTSGSFGSVNLPTGSGINLATLATFSQLTVPAAVVAALSTATPAASSQVVSSAVPLPVLVTPQQTLLADPGTGSTSSNAPGTAGGPAGTVSGAAPSTPSALPIMTAGPMNANAGSVPANGAGTDALNLTTDGARAGQRFEPSWYVLPDGVVPYFRNLPLGDIDRAELTTMLDERRSYKFQLLSAASALLETDPDLADVLQCTPDQVGDVDSGECALNEAVQKELLRKSVAQQRTADTTQAFVPQIARKRALVIGLNKYADKRIPQLVSAIPDAHAIRDSLNDKLGYDVTLLENPGKAQIVQAFNRIALEMAPSDSLVVYFAGHGELVEKTQLGYWIPADAKADDPRGWISNKDVSRLLSLVKSKQVAMISDSCYSGTFAREESVEASQKNNGRNATAYLTKRSVTVMTSGADEPVADTGKGGHSVFAWNLLEQIKQLDDWSAGATVFSTVRIGVERDLPQSPQYGASISAGHQQGGDFLFERRKRIR